MDIAQYKNSKFKDDIQSVVQSCNALRSDPNEAVDISLAEMVQMRHQVSLDAYYEDLGFNASVDTIQNLFTTGDANTRWLIPEIIRDALTLGLRKAPIYSNLIAAEQSIPNPTLTLPWWNMSDAMPRYVGEAETIPQGSLSYGEKTLSIRKMGRGLKIPYEVVQYVTANIFGIFLQDFGVKLGMGIDAMLIDVLINGEQADGSESAPVIGTISGTSVVYKDILTIWVRMSRIGRQPQSMVSGETMAVDIMDLDEFKLRQNPFPPEKGFNLKTPIPNSTDMYIHGSVPADQTIIVDRTGSVIKYNAQPLLVENDKIVSNQTLETYATLTTGFGILYRDARIVLDRSVTIAVSGFPTYMDVDPLEQETIEKNHP